MPFERLVEEINPPRALGRNPLFQVMLVLQNNADPELDLPGLRSRPEPVGAYASQFDLSLDLTERHDDAPAGVSARLDYSAELFDPSTARSFVERFRRFVEAVVADPDRPIGEVDLLGADERHRLLVERNRSERATDTFDLVARVREHAVRSPAAVALADDDSELDYRTLVRRASALSRRLLEAGAGRGSLVALCAERRVSVPVAVLGVLGAGAAFLPVDPNAPRARNERILARSGARVVLADEHHHELATRLADVASAEVLPLDESQDGPEELLEPRGGPDDLAYVLYTSGSTGAPKGALVHRRGMVNHLFAKVEDLAVTESDSLVQNAPLTFDISVWQMLAPLLVGGRTRVVGDGTARDPERLFRVVAEERITVLEVVPSLLRAALDTWDTVASTSGSESREAGGSVPSDLRWLMVTGEALPPDLCTRWFEYEPAVPLVNAYGPTECSDDVTHAVITPESRTDDVRIPIGRVVRNTRLYVLDEALRPVPDGIPGELCVGGAGVGHGYLGDPVKTALAFVPDPLSGEAGARLYRTGDRVRYRADGQLEFLGRDDQQVKIRGQRIELGEVEAALRAAEEVRDAVVTVHRDSAGQARLAGYVTGTSDTTAVRAALAGNLTEAMTPAVLVPLETLPLSPNGKVDRNRLPEPEFPTSASGREPATPQEEMLCQLFAEVLGAERVDVDDDFFALGGHSLLATRLVNRIRSVTGVEVSMRALFETPTVTGVAEHLGNPSHVRSALRRFERPERVPLSFAQRRLWFLNRFSETAGAYNVPLALRLTGELDVAALRAAIGDVVDRHESLRTVFPQHGEEPHQVVLADARPETPLETLDNAELTGRLDELVRTEFDLTTETPLRSRLFRTGEREHVLLLLMHHIASDGGSAAPLARDLSTAYRARGAGQEPSPAPLEVQYADFTLWQREVLGDEQDPDSPLSRQLRFWEHALSGIPEELDLPTDRARPAVPSHRGARVPIEISAGVHGGLLGLAAGERA
ncbi:hypothetical protein IL38_24400, partial [Actinopolyspora erythraea]